MAQAFPYCTLFLAALDPARASSPDDALEDALTHALAEARVAWPGVDVGTPDFVVRIAAFVGDAAGLADAVRALHTSDLYLATGLLAGVPRAVAAFEREVLAPTVNALSGLAPSDRDEVGQLLRERLLVSTAGTPARIAGYRARGPLGGWVRVAAARLAVDLHRQRGAEVPLEEDRVVATASDPELGHLRTLYAGEFRAAVSATLAELPVGDRTMMRLYFFEGMTHRAIGALLDVHETTVLRRLARCRQDILDGTRQRLAERLRLASSELDSVLGLLDGELSASFSPILGRTK